MCSVVPCRAVFAFLVFTCALLASAAEVRAEDVTVNVQCVAASDPGKQKAIPASLKAYETQLKDAGPFATFTDAGKDTVKAAAGGNGSVTLSGYAVDVSVLSKTDKGHAKVQITIKENGKPIATPVKFDLSSRPMMMKAGDPNAPKIFLFTIKDE